MALTDDRHEKQLVLDDLIQHLKIDIKEAKDGIYRDKTSIRKLKRLRKVV